MDGRSGGGVRQGGDGSEVMATTPAPTRKDRVRFLAGPQEKTLKLICQIGYWTAAIAIVLVEDKVKQLAQEFSMWITVEDH
jgi:hypothetical protein